MRDVPICSYATRCSIAVSYIGTPNTRSVTCFKEVECVNSAFILENEMMIVYLDNFQAN